MEYFLNVAVCARGSGCSMFAYIILEYIKQHNRFNNKKEVSGSMTLRMRYKPQKYGIQADRRYVASR